MTHIISIANEKGGVAKTTTTISLGAALVETGLEVLLIDLDGQANLSLALGIDSKKGQPTIVNLLLESALGRSIIRETGIPRLDIMPSSAELNLAERFLPLRQGYEKTLSNSLRDGKLGYDYILLDCPPFLGAVTFNALMASDLLIMPTQAEFFSINALRNMMGLVRKIRAQGNPRLSIVC